MSLGSAAPSNGTVRRSRRRSTLMMGLTSAAVVAGTLLPGAAAAASSASGPALPTVPEPVVPGAGAASVRGEISGRTTVRVATPVPGQTTILRLIVASASTPKIAVAAAVPSAGTRAVTAVGGAKLLPNRRAAGAGTYAITVPIIKPKVAGATARPGTLAVSILGTRLRVLSKTVYSNTTTSMAQVVASNNLKAAATNEGDALLIRRTKEAEASGTAVRIEAEAERTAAQLRGQGVALFRGEVARGLAQAAREMESNSVDQSLILFSMWTESLRHVAENGKGNVLFLDGSPAGMQKQMQDLMAMQQLHVVQPPK